MTCAAGVGGGIKEDRGGDVAEEGPEKVFACPPQEKVDADELNPAEFDDGHEGGLDAKAEQEGGLIEGSGDNLGGGVGTVGGGCGGRV